MPEGEGYSLLKGSFFKKYQLLMMEILYIESVCYRNDIERATKQS